MGPKKDKNAIDENFWRTLIETAPLDDPTWTVKVVFMEAAGGDQDRIYLNKFEVFAAEERRFVIKNICRTETIFMVNQLGGEKKVKDDNLRVFEEGQAFLKDKKDIPPDILALIIKHLILKMKEEYLIIKRQRLEVREGLRRESDTMISKAEVRGTVNVKPQEPAEPRPEPKGKGKKGESENVDDNPQAAEGKKYNTILRVRGEEWRDKVYVDDFPVDGPNLYVAITGFVEPYLPACLIEIGVPLTAVVQIRIDPTSVNIPSSLSRATKRGQSQTEILADKSLKFWEDIQQLRIQRDTTEDFKNTAFIIFSPPYWSAESLSGNPDKIYDELCFLMYDIQDLTRQHLNYLDNMEIINIPEEITDDRYKNYYLQQIDDLPLECVTIYSVLDSILHTVCNSQKLEEESSKSSLLTDLTFNQPRKSIDAEEKVEKAETLVKDVFNTLCKTDTNKKEYRTTYGEEYESHMDPIVINNGDFAKYTTFHLGNINLNNIVFSMLLGMPVHNLWKNQDRPSGELEAKVNFHVNVLLSCFNREDVETAELNRLMHILACRKLFNNRSSLKKHHLPQTTVSDFKKVYLKRSVLAEPLPICPSLFRICSSSSPSFPSMTKNENASEMSYESDSENKRIKFLFDCPDISELVSAAEIALEKPIDHMIDDFDFFEDFSGISAFQIMLEAFNKFNCLDYKYCEVTDSLILMFFNSHDKDGIAREEWRCHLPTPLCLQDFFDFVLEEHYDWIQNQEKIYDENMLLKAKSDYKDIIDPLAMKSCVENADIDMELLIEGSLKHQDIFEAEAPNPEESDSKITSKKTVLSVSSTDLESKGSKKIKSPATSNPKNIRRSFLTQGLASESSIIISKKPFLGYDLCDRRVEVFGKDATFFSKDGTHVSSAYTLIIPNNLEYIILNVTPGNGYNEFWIHRAIGEFVTSEVLDKCESFRITSKDRVMINIKKQSYQVPLPTLTFSLTGNLKQKSSLGCSPNFSETKTFYSLLVTWPNGLITESVHEENSGEISHIKQFYVKSQPHLDEDMRCISLNGEVIIFKTSGDIEVLRPDSSFIKITKCEKRIILPDIIENAQSDISSDKSKKGKGKEKSSKPASKTSRLISDENIIPEVTPPQYELIVEEFEIIEASGLRQQWINENFFNIEKLLNRTATDYCLGEVFSRRMDGTSTLLNKDGIQIVTFPNKTRIITHFVVEDLEIFPEWTQEEKEYFDMLSVDVVDIDTLKSKASLSQKSYGGTCPYTASIASSSSRKFGEEEMKQKVVSDGYISVQLIYTIEHANFTTITINKVTGKIIVESPNNTSVIMDRDNHYTFYLDNMTSANFNGENLNINYDACFECESHTTCDIKIHSHDKCSVTKLQQNWLKMRDSFYKTIVVNEEGGINLIEEPISEEIVHEETHAEETVNDTGNIENTGNVDKLENLDNIEEKLTDTKSETSITSRGKCRRMYQARFLRFFVLRRELTCSELVHKTLVEQYKRMCQWQPWCSINRHDTFDDNRSLVSVLTPIHITETEKWLMESKLADKPKCLTYKDLKKDCGKGFYHWMRPYERFEPKPMKPANVLPPRLPRAFILRTLEKQWQEPGRTELKGAKELINAILRYRRIMESDSETILNVPVLDPRLEDERLIDDILQALAHRLYENLKMRLADDVQSRAKLTITTQPPPKPEEASIEGEMEEEITDELKTLEEERESQLKEVEAIEEMSPNLKRYWRRRAEELKEEQFYTYLLREGSVPPYFRNVLGGAIWWEMNNTAGEAVFKAERRKMKCVCVEEATVQSDDILTVPVD